MKIIDVKKLIIKTFKKFNLSEKHSNICANALINAELVGAHSHGIIRLPSYCKRIKKKVINAKPKIKIRNISQSITNIDADNAIGFVGADLGINCAIKNAKKTGIGLVGIKNSGHYGLSGYYAEQAVKKNLLVFCFTNAPPAIAPYGSRKSLFGTNPICFGTPTSSKIPFILDTSVSVINRGKVRVAAKLGLSVDRSTPPGTQHPTSFIASLRCLLVLPLTMEREKHRDKDLHGHEVLMKQLRAYHGS